MKNKFTASLSIVMCLVLIVSCFAACKVKDKTNGETTTLAPADSWQSGSGYEKVPVGKAELVGIVEGALGEEMPENFNGDRSTLTPEQLDKVEDFAKNEGFFVEKDENGDVIIKEEVIPTQPASDDEIGKLFDKLSIKDPSNLSKEEIEELSKVAGNEGLIVHTKPDGNVVIVKPVTTTKIVTRAPQTESTKRSDKTTKSPSPHTTSVYIPEHVTASPTGKPIDNSVSTLSNGWITNFAAGAHTVLVESYPTSDGGFVSVGITADSGNSGVVVKYNSEGKKQWSNVLSGNALVSFDGVTELKDGSIVVVGSTAATDITSPDQYICKDTVEALVVKYSASGKQQWTKILGGSGDDMLYAVEPTSDGGFIAGGKTNSADGSFSGLSENKTKAFIYKFNSNGGVSWKTCLSGKIHCAVIDLAINPKGEIFAAMENNNKDGDFASLEGTANGRRTGAISKLTSNGQFVWTQSLYESSRMDLTAITYTDDGGCVVAGQYSVSAKEGNNGSFKGIYNGGTPGTFDGYIAKFNANGSRAWVTPLIGFESDYVTDIARIKNGYAVSGFSKSNNRDFQGMGRGDYDAFVCTFAKSGEKQSLHHFGGSSADNARTVCLNGNNLFVSGQTHSTDGDLQGVTPTPSGENDVAMIRCYKIS